MFHHCAQITWLGQMINDPFASDDSDITFLSFSVNGNFGNYATHFTLSSPDDKNKD